MRDQDKLGKPDIKIAGLSIWVHGREREGDLDYWNGNWVRVTVQCKAQGAEVITSGSIIHLPEIAALLKGAKA